jgi:hypothetical protein
MRFFMNKLSEVRLEVKTLALTETATPEMRTILRMNKEKGWLIPPPLHIQTPELAHV